MPIFAQLEEFRLYGHFYDCIQLLKQLGPNIQKLALKFVNIGFVDFEELLKQNSSISQISHLSTECINFEDKTDFHFICDNFKMLKYLEVKPEPSVSIA